MRKLLLIFTTILLMASSLIEPTKEITLPIVLEPIPITEIIVENIQLNDIELINALIIVESQGNASAIGDENLGEPSIGVLQIRPIMVREVNRILKLKRSKIRFKRKDRFSRTKSIEMFRIWKEFHYDDADFEVIARNWNGGAKGYKRSSTLHYWQKVEIELTKNK